jgi:hypothetical protein
MRPFGNINPCGHRNLHDKLPSRAFHKQTHLAFVAEEKVTHHNNVGIVSKRVICTFKRND